MMLSEFIKKTLLEVCEEVGQVRSDIHERTGNYVISPSTVEKVTQVDSLHNTEPDIATIVQESLKTNSIGGSTSVCSSIVNL